MPIFCQKNVSSLKKTVLPCYLFQIYHEKRYAVIPKSAQKNVNSVKTILSYEPKKLIGSYFFPIFNQETTLLMPIFLSKIVRSLKNTMLSCPYFVEKTSIPIINCDFDPKSCHICSRPHSHSLESRFFSSQTYYSLVLTVLTF